MEKKLERTPEFEEKVKNQETATFKTPELDMMTQEEFDTVIPYPCGASRPPPVWPVRLPG